MLRFRQTCPKYQTARMRCRFLKIFYLSKHVEFYTLLWWTEWRATHFVSFLIILKNNCTDDSSSKVHLFTKFKLKDKWNTLVSASTRKREGVTSPIRQIFYKYVVFGLFFLFWNHCLFFGSHQVRNYSLLGMGQQNPSCTPKHNTSHPTTGSWDKPAVAHMAEVL